MFETARNSISKVSGNRRGAVSGAVFKFAVAVIILFAVERACQ